MKTVQSKYKNPDEHIKRLKLKMKRQECSKEYWRKQEGVFLHNLTCSQESNRWGEMYDGLIPGDTIVALCDVGEVRLYSDGGKRAGHIKITVRQLRKRK